MYTVVQVSHSVNTRIKLSIETQLRLIRSVLLYFPLTMYIISDETSPKRIAPKNDWKMKRNAVINRRIVDERVAGSSTPILN